MNNISQRPGRACGLVQVIAVPTVLANPIGNFGTYANERFSVGGANVVPGCQLIIPIA